MSSAAGSVTVETRWRPPDPLLCPHLWQEPLSEFAFSELGDLHRLRAAVAEAAALAGIPADARDGLVLSAHEAAVLLCRGVVERRAAEDVHAEDLGASRCSLEIRHRGGLLTVRLRGPRPPECPAFAIFGLPPHQDPLKLLRDICPGAVVTYTSATLCTICIVTARARPGVAPAADGASGSAPATATLAEDHTS